MTKVIATARAVLAVTITAATLTSTFASENNAISVSSLENVLSEKELVNQNRDAKAKWQEPRVKIEEITVQAHSTAGFKRALRVKSTENGFDNSKIKLLNSTSGRNELPLVLWCLLPI